MLLREAAKEHKWNLNYGSIANVWREGCIIRSAFLGRIKEAGVLGVPVNQEKVRFVTHRDVSRGMIDEAIARIARL